MKITGSTNEIIELKNLPAGDCDAFADAEEGSFTIAWFQADHNKFVVDGETHFFARNQIIFFTEFHKVNVVTKGEIHFLKFNRPFYCVLDHDEEVSCRGALFYGSSHLPQIQIPDEEVEHFHTLWKMFTIEMASQDHLQLGMLQMMLKRYLILCTRLHNQQHRYPKDKTDSEIVREFNFLVERHFKTHHKVAEYADLMHKSPKTISNIFSRISAKTPLKLIQERIMLEARRLLFYTEKPVKEVAHGIGFEDIQTFSRFFKHQEGVSPSEFREKAQHGNYC